MAQASRTPRQRLTLTDATLTSGTCPACKQPLTGQLAVELNPTPVVDTEGKVSFGGSVVGFKVDHNCVPQAVRSAARAGARNAAAAASAPPAS
jgi:hypothetical protein